MRYEKWQWSDTSAPFMAIPLGALRRQALDAWRCGCAWGTKREKVSNPLPWTCSLFCCSFEKLTGHRCLETINQSDQLCLVNRKQLPQAIGFFSCIQHMCGIVSCELHKRKWELERFYCDWSTVSVSYLGMAIWFLERKRSHWGEWRVMCEMNFNRCVNAAVCHV